MWVTYTHRCLSLHRRRVRAIIAERDLVVYTAAQDPLHTDADRQKCRHVQTQTQEDSDKTFFGGAGLIGGAPACAAGVGCEGAPKVE